MNRADHPAPAFEYAFCFANDHPSLPGHFPGHPLVPGVLLLEQVAIALRQWRGERLARVVEAKFVAPLLPGEKATVRLTLARMMRVSPAAEQVADAAAARVRFEVLRDDTVLARGMVEGAA